jgi:hypothetical protein
MRHRHAQTGYENIVDNVKTLKSKGPSQIVMNHAS